MHIVIAEDEKVSGRRLKRMVGELLGEALEECVLTHSMEECLSYVSQHSIDLLLLDLNLNGKDGFTLLKELQEKKFQTIVVSANTDRAIEAFELGITDFIAKPYDTTRLAKALNRFSGRLNREQEAQTLVVKNCGERLFIPVSSIIYISGAKDYSELHCSKEPAYLYSKSLENLHQILPARFIRIHKSYIVDTTKIDRVRVYGGGRYRAHLCTGEELPISRAKYKQFFT
ncbi:LytR/AlgR family response regulator transcription factor [Chitinivibrio alkaliphilus]|uniref:Response regulator of the LytR/AlgR family n=1 Tax=Chitinivibrio alkaliphilus ACht1 TaxID=1313304 RepID=U7D8W3_9BACT|nr:LytTR family DNA-binding domain-containing protein [Chitinivibrio alkaliphilus]ERP32026.1 response regulator of the LytR/AlgR family [Chitinivibrio alkaliphilus ACht1]